MLRMVGTWPIDCEKPMRIFPLVRMSLQTKAALLFARALMQMNPVNVLDTAFAR